MRLGEFVVKHKLLLVLIFAVALIVSIVLYFFVDVNYDSSKYMPEGSKMSEGIKIMYDEFDGNSLAQIMIEDLSYTEALNLKSEIEKIDGVNNVIWLDTMLSTVVDRALPLINADIEEKYTSIELTEYLLAFTDVLPKPTGDKLKRFNSCLLKLFEVSGELGLPMNALDQMSGELKGFYKDGAVLMQVMFIDTDYSERTYAAMEEIRALNYDTHMLGNPAMVYNSRKTINKQTLVSLGIAGAIIIVILFIASSSYFEPILLLAAIGVAVILNMGTDIILPEVSYMTKSIASVLQLALTMDYSIVLLHRFKQERALCGDPNMAMARAVKHSFSPISASSLTTITSFIAIMFMSYTIGRDLGFVLMKGVVFSILSVFFLLPALTLYSLKLLDRSEHKTFKLNFKRHCSFLIKTVKFLPIIIVLIVLPCIYMQSANTFTYGNGATFGGKSSIIYEDRVSIENVFGTQNQSAILLPKAYADKEIELSEKLLAVDGVKSVQSFALIKQSGMAELMPEALLGQFKSRSGDYIRIAIFLDVPEESEETTAVINSIHSTISNVIGSDDYYLVGESPSVLEIKKVVESDYSLISILSVLFVAIIIAIAFKSLLVPVILVLTIESAIWIAMSIPFLMGTPMVFIGYLVISAILLGTTIDYAILYANNYMRARLSMRKDEALRSAIASSSKTIITSATIFTCIGFAVGAISTMPAINLFGTAIGFGGLTSMLLVLVFLPQLMYLFDKPVQYLTRYARKNFCNAVEPPPYALDEKIEDANSDCSNDCNCDISEINNENIAKDLNGLNTVENKSNILIESKNNDKTTKAHKK